MSGEYGAGEEREKKKAWLKKIIGVKTFFMDENHMTPSALTLFHSDEIFFANRIEALYPSIVLRKQEEDRQGTRVLVTD